MSQKTKKPATLDDIFDAVNGLTESTAIEFKSIRQEFKHDLAAMETRLVTKDYLDEKLTDLKGDLTTLLRKEDHKVNTVVSILHQHQVLSDQDVEQVDQTLLFPKTIVV